MSDSFKVNPLPKEGMMDYFSKKYDQSYTEYNGTSIIFVSIITIVTASVVYYTYIIKDLKDLRDNWQDEKCKVQNLPFAGIINPPTDGTSFMEYTANNLSDCLNDITEEVADNAMKPFNIAIDSIKNVFGMMLAAVNVVRQKLNGMRDSIAEIMGRFYIILHTILLEINRLVLKVRDTFSKVVGVVKASVFSVMSTFMALTSFMGAMMQIMIISLLILFATAIALSFIPFVGFAISMPIFIFAMLISGVLIYIRVGAPKVFELMNYSVPSGSPPGRCFSGDTKIKMSEGHEKNIKDLLLGDNLINNNKIVAIMKLDGRDDKNNKLYKLGNVYVTENHKVKYKNDYIEVKNHPDVEKINRKDDILYCINTTHKIINIDDYEFLDYDEMLDNEYEKLKKHLLNKNIETENLKSKMHNYFDGGFNENTIIEMNDGTIKPIKKIKAGDVLVGNIKVYGIVKMDNYDINNSYVYNLKNEIKYNKRLICSNNILLTNNNIFKNLSNINQINRNYNGYKYNGHKYIGNSYYEESYPGFAGNNLILYHLLTEQGYFKVENLNVLDYNSLINYYLEI